MPFPLAKIARYGTVTIVSQAVLFLGTLLAVELLNLPASSSYIAVLTLVYIGVYASSSRWVFKQHHTTAQGKRFVTAVIIFWLLNSATYNVLVEALQIQYLLAVVINIILFGGLRYLVYQRWVFATPPAQVSPQANRTDYPDR